MNKQNYLFLTAIFALLLSQLNAQQFYFSQVQPSSCNANDGIITLVPTSGVPPFSYLWSDGSTEISLRNIPKGSYSATLTDATGATVTHNSILNTKALDVKLAGSNPSGGCNPNSGSLNINVVDGQAPFTYSWSNGATDAFIQGLAAGTYSVLVQDANGCLANGEFVVSNLGWQYFASAQISSSDQPDCTNLNNGFLTANLVYSPYPPFTYNWSNGGTDQNIANLAKGTYTVTITDALGCSASSSFFLDNKIIANGSVICTGNTSGTADAQLVNATAPVNYAWSNGQNGANLSGLTDGFYTVIATDAQGCNATTEVRVAAPTIQLYDYSFDCYSGNNGYGYCILYNDQAVSYLWDNGETNAWANTLSPGIHSVTVTTALGCTLSESVTITQAIAPAYSIVGSSTPADCANNLGGTLSLTISGGLPSYTLYVYGPDGFLSTDLNTLQNLQSGDYFVSISAGGFFSCYGNATVHVADAGGFEPSLVTTELNCNTGFGDAAIINANTPNVQYAWSTGDTGPALFNLTQGCYSVTVTGGGSCVEYMNFCMPKEDTIGFSQCGATVSGKLIHDQGLNGCNGTTGIPYQLIRTMPSGAINFTDQNGDYAILLPNGTYDLDAVQYSAGDIACPAGGVHTVNSVIGQPISGLDFHFLNNNALDLRIQQRPLRTAQPGYPYSLRVEVCNDGNAASPGTIDFEYGNLLGSLTNRYFAQHPGAIVLNSDNAGSPNNNADFSFPNLSAGACELLQLDLQIGTNTAVNSEFITDARVSPSAGDPTPANNISTMYNTVVGSFDPNCVLAYPARNGNPKDGGEIIRDQDNTIVYQIFFQNTGNAAANQVVVRDLLDPNLDLSSIRNISATHNMKVLSSEDNKELIFKFDNIGLPDSTSDYAGSIGSIQYQIDLKPGLSLGTEVKKQASIFFDFNSPVITNQNVLELVNSSKVTVLNADKELRLFPNPADGFTGFYCDGPSQMSIYNTTGALITTAMYEAGLQQINTVDLPNGIYMIRLETNGKTRSGKVVVCH